MFTFVSFMKENGFFVKCPNRHSGLSDQIVLLRLLSLCEENGTYGDGMDGRSRCGRRNDFKALRNYMSGQMLKYRLMWSECWNISKLGECQRLNISNADLEASWNVYVMMPSIRIWSVVQWTELNKATRLFSYDTNMFYHYKFLADNLVEYW